MPGIFWRQCGFEKHCRWQTAAHCAPTQKSPAKRPGFELIEKLRQ
jgi:hypothetical protein